VENRDNISDICIIGLGSAGLGAAFSYVEMDSKLNIVCIDAGRSINERYCNLFHEKQCCNNKFCDIICGFGGSALFGGSKISNYPAGENMKKILGSEKIVKQELLNTLKLFKEHMPLELGNLRSPDIGNDYYKKLGFNFKYYDSYIVKEINLRSFFQFLYERIKSSVNEILFNTQLIDIKEEGPYFNLVLNKNGTISNIYSKRVILALGRFGINTMAELSKKFKLHSRPNKIDIGFRIEFPTELWEKIDDFHNDLKLHFLESRTFCLCKNGKVISYRINNTQFSEGYLDIENPSGKTNISILFRIKESGKNYDIYNLIMERLANIDNNNLIMQDLESYLSSKKYPNNVCKERIEKCYPEDISEKIKESIEFFIVKFFKKTDWNNINIFGPELSYGGMIFNIDSSFAIKKNLYIIGESTGQFRGILQSFCSGSICMRKILGDYVV